MTPAIVITVIACYFALLLGVGWLAGRRTRRDDNRTFFTGGRRAPWPAVAFAMIGAAMSGVTFISVPGMVVGKSFAYLQMILGFIVGYLLIAWVLVPMFYKRRLLSIYGYLDERFGTRTYRAGAWMFFISKITGASVRFFVVCATLQVLVFGPLGIPFEVNVAATIALIWLYTARAGVTAVIWADVLKTFVLLLSVGLCIVFIASALGLGLGDVAATVREHPASQAFFFDDPRSAQYFWKQFLAGIFMAIATNGLDQDMMQRNLACRDSASSRKNMIVSSVLQFFVVSLFLVLGILLMLYASHTGMAIPEKTDELFGLVACSPAMPLAVGILFVLGLTSAAYSAAGSALTSLTTSFTVDILGAASDDADPARLARKRRMVHLGMSALMGLIIIVFYRMSSSDAISAVYTLASYTYGPILGLFAYGMCCKRSTIDALVPYICVAAPVLSWLTSRALYLLWGYETGFELLIINAAITGLLLGLGSLRQGRILVND